MILLIGKNNEVEKIIHEINFSKLGIWERTHMEEWIANYPQILGEDLLTITTEYDKFDKTKNRLDILAIDTKGKLVIIELKRDVAGKFVDLQAIHYAAYCSTLNMEHVIDHMADYYNESKDVTESEIRRFIENEEFSDFDDQPRIILVANDFKEETLSAVLWLIDNGLDITCVKLESYRIENKIAIKPEIIIPLPEAKDFTMQVVEKKKSSTKLSLRKQEYKKFWDELVQEYKKVDPNFKSTNPHPQHWLWYGAGKTGLNYSWIFDGKQFTLELYINTPEADRNSQIFNEFHQKKDEIEEKIGGLYWHNPEGKKIKKIRLLKGVEADIMDISEDQTRELITWGVNSMIKFKKTFDPFIHELD